MGTDHTCIKNFTVKLATSTFLSDLYREKILANPHWKLREFKADILEKYKINVSYTKFSRARKRACGEVEKTLIEHYKCVRDYGEEILRVNPGSTIKIEVERDEPSKLAYFKRFYMCLDALKRGWKVGCRPILGLDGYFFKGYCKGQLLSAVRRDGNNFMYPVAWAVVEGENKDSWCWFLDLLKRDLDYEQGHGLTLISDHQKGLMHAIQELLPFAEHQNCARHIYNNLRKRHIGAQLKLLFWSAAKSGTPQEFQGLMNEIKEFSCDAYQYCMDQNPNVWSRAYFQTHSSCDSVDNNMCKTFNATILEARPKSIITLLEKIRVYCMTRLQRKKEELGKCNDRICPRIREQLEKNKDGHRFWSLSYNGDEEFEVRRSSLDGYVVNLRVKSYTSRMWYVSGIPCPHAISAIYYKNDNPDNYAITFFWFWHVRNFLPGFFSVYVVKLIAGRPQLQ